MGLGFLNKIPVQDGTVTTGLFAREETRRERETLVCIRKTRDDESNLAAQKRGNMPLLSTLYAQREREREREGKLHGRGEQLRF